MKTHRAARLLLALGLLASGVAWAGMKAYSWQVVISTGNRYAFGSLGSARNSPDTRQAIGCAVYGSTTGKSMYCFATDSNGVSVSCSSTASPLVDVASTLTGDSYLYFTYDANGQCTNVYVYNTSYLEPKAP